MALIILEMLHFITPEAFSRFRSVRILAIRMEP